MDSRSRARPHVEPAPSDRRGDGHAPPGRGDDGDVLRLRGVTRRFGDVTAVDRLDLDVHRGELLAVLGPSGCGKTTALRLVAGLEVPDEGTIELDGRIVADEQHSVPPERRRIGMVFQDYALFPHLSVAENVGYGLPRRHPDRARRIARALELVELGHVGDRRPSQLSGGQQQRVALARALAPVPTVVLLDEPFSNLDAALREAVRDDVRRILRRVGTTGVFVTHDQDEALSVADRVAVMEAGRLHQVAAPPTLYAEPATRFVATFVGDADIVAGRRAGHYLLDTPIGRLSTAGPLEGPEHEAVLRPEAVTVHTHGQADATVAGITYFGHDQVVALDLDSGPRVRSRTVPREDLAVGARVRVELTGKVVTFPVTGHDRPTAAVATPDR